MKEYLIKFSQRIKRTPEIESFRFLPRQKIAFLPGQFAKVFFDRERPNKELNKYLSFSSPPTKDYIEFTKRLADSQFSSRLRELKAADEILIKAPLGSCVFKDEYKRISFLIGGIGITPVISIIEYIMDKKLDTDVCLLYSNRSEEEIAFKAELDGWAKLNQRIQITYAVSDCQPKDRACIFGQIDKNLVQQKVCDLSQRRVFIFGPPKMVATMGNLCLDLGCDQGSIQTENFVGY